MRGGRAQALLRRKLTHVPPPRAAPTHLVKLQPRQGVAGPNLVHGPNLWNSQQASTAKLNQHGTQSQSQSQTQSLRLVVWCSLQLQTESADC